MFHIMILDLFPCYCLQVSADKLNSITAFTKFFSQVSYTKLAPYRRAIFQALEVSCTNSRTIILRADF